MHRLKRFITSTFFYLWEGTGCSNCLNGRRRLLGLLMPRQSRRALFKILRGDGARVGVGSLCWGPVDPDDPYLAIKITFQDS